MITCSTEYKLPPIAGDKSAKSKLKLAHAIIQVMSTDDWRPVQNLIFKQEKSLEGCKLCNHSIELTFQIFFKFLKCTYWNEVNEVLELACPCPRLQ